MRSFLVVLIFFSPLILSADLGSLLSKYEKESDLSKETKDENAGNLIVYTRDDLERMQVETLKDILKSLRFFRYLENRLGEPDTFNADPIAHSSKAVRIYLNDNELLLPRLGSGVSMFGNIDMDFIDHVEIYGVFPSFKFGVEPAVLVIRLYSKSALHDLGTRVKVQVGSRGSNKENIYTTGDEEGYSYFLYANHSDENRDTYDVNLETLKRDVSTNSFYGSLSKDNYKIELNAMSVSSDAFLGFLPYAVPNDAEIDKNYINFSLNSKFLNDSLSFDISYLHSSSHYEAKYTTPVPAQPPVGFFNEMQRNGSADALTAILQKRFELDIHSVSVGLQYRYKYFNFYDMEYDSVKYHVPQVYDREDIYSLFLEDSISISSYDLIGISVMQQYYARNKKMKDESIPQLRLSYVHSKDGFVAKTFISRQEFVPEPYATAQPNIGNPELDPEVYSAISQEVSYETKDFLSKVVLGYGKSENFLVPTDITMKVKNSDDDLITYAASLEFSYFFREKDKLDLAVNYIYIDVSNLDHVTQHYNYLIRMINTISKFDIFNELVINTGFDGLDNGFDYSAGVRYRVNPDFHINLKGENIFDTGLTRKYYYSVVPPAKKLEVPVIEQKFMLSMEYLF